MVAARYAYSKGRYLVRGISAVFAITFGFIALFFTETPKVWSSVSPIFGGFSVSNIAHAEIGSGGDSGGGCAGDCGGDCGGW